MRTFTADWLALLCLVLLGVSCARQQTPSVSGGVPGPVTTARIEQPQDPSVIYNQMGLIAPSGTLAYVGKVAYFATSSPDTTMVLASVSISNRVLSFVRDGDTYRAPYEIRLRINRGLAEVKTVNASEIVRVGTFKEVNRTDESVIFQNYFRLSPGDYSISFQLRDVASNRSAGQEGLIVVPRLKMGHMSTPVLVYEATPRSALDSLPQILTSPRSSAIFGRDSLISVYLEGYGQQRRLPVSFVVQNDRGAVTIRDTIFLERHGNLLSGSVRIPISRVGIGIANVTFTRADATDTVRTPVFVSFGSDIPLLSFEEALAQLRYYVAPDRIKSLRETPVDGRGSAWAAFLRLTDPVPVTPEHEGLEGYFSRLRQASVRYRDDGVGRAGWLSDRAKVFVVLGEPDQIYEQSTNMPLSRSSVAQRGRLQYWEYSQYRVRLIFYDEGSISRWRLTPISETEFQNINVRLLVH